MMRLSLFDMMIRSVFEGFINYLLCVQQKVLYFKMDVNEERINDENNDMK